MFRRREPRTTLTALREAVWPRGGWPRALTYMQLRLQRLPDPPRRIARGVGAGVFCAFTPFYGLHFLLAWGMARAIRGNGVAGLIGTFFGNPLTYVPIAWVSLTTGHWILGTGQGLDGSATRGAFDAFGEAGRDLWHNAMAAFGPERARWDGLEAFWAEVFWPWLVGGVPPGLAFGLIAYGATLPAIAAYQTARKGRLKARLAALREKAAEKAAETRETAAAVTREKAAAMRDAGRAATAARRPLAEPRRGP